RTGSSKPAAVLVVHGRRRRAAGMERGAVRVGMASSKAHVRVRSAAAALSAGLPADGDLCILGLVLAAGIRLVLPGDRAIGIRVRLRPATVLVEAGPLQTQFPSISEDRKSTRLNSSHLGISYAVFCLKKKK